MKFIGDLGDLGKFIFLVSFLILFILWNTSKDDTKEEKKHKSILLIACFFSLIIFLFLFFASWVRT